MSQMATEQKKLKTIQTLNTVALIGAPISLIIGGIALSTVAVICAIVARVKLRPFLKQASQASNKKLISILARQTLVAGLISAFAFVLNGFVFMTLMGMLIPAIQTGDFTQLSEMFGVDQDTLQGFFSHETNIANNGSIWD